MILAAGRGERMRPLTDRTPKPLLAAAGKTLLEYHIEALREAGYHDLVINLGHLGKRIAAKLGDGRQFGVAIAYSQEPPGALETGGGIFRALPLLGSEPFLVINGDIWTDYPRARLLDANPRGLAHLVLVDNPPHVPQGDFCLQDGQVFNHGVSRLTFGCISVLRPKLFDHCRPGRFSVVPLLRRACDKGLVSGERYCGRWYDIGTPERLARLEVELRMRGT